MSNYYNTLGIDKSASSDEIKKAYRKLAMQYHPDRHGGDKDMEAKFKEVNEAYAVLSDQQKRANYDQFGSAEGFGGAGGFNVDFDIGDIFSSVFGQGFGGGGDARGRRTTGEDIQIQEKISFEEAYTGIRKNISYKRNISCTSCNGNGTHDGSRPDSCPRCHGRGQVMEQVKSIFGVIQQNRICPECKGTGEIIKNACKDCKGNKVIAEKVEEEIEFPAGIDEGMTIKMSGKGHEISGGISGDLYIVCDVEQDHQGLKREGADLHYTLHLDPVEVVLGVKKDIQIPLIGKRSVHIHAGTLDGKVIQFSGDGMRSVQRDSRGDLFITCKILVPKKLSKEEKKLYEQIQKLKK